MIMGGNSVDDEWEFASSSKEVRTIVLVGRTGNGKSATGNSILGDKVFDSKLSSSGVTNYCQMQTTLLNDGVIVNVIDTPGLFDNSAGSEFLGEEIVRCIDLAKDGIHAILVVFSVRTRFTNEEETSLRSLQKLFGSKIVNYVIVVFTGGDELEDNYQTLDDYLGSQCPEPLKKVISLCDNRCMLFDNKTKDEKKRYGQVKQLLSLVDTVISQNDGRPYTDELFTEMKKGAMKLENQQKVCDSLKGSSKEEISEMKIQLKEAYDEQLKRLVETIESKLRETTSQLEKELAEEKGGRLKAEENAKKAQEKSDDEIRKLREDLRKAEEELRKKFGCAIL